MHKTVYSAVLITFFLATAAFFVGCSGDSIGTKTVLDSGISYTIWRTAGNEKGANGDIIEFDRQLFIDNKLIANSYTNPLFQEREIVGRIRFEGDFVEVLSNLSSGDSAEMEFPIARLPETVQKSLGINAQSAKNLRLIVSVLDVWNETERINEFTKLVGLNKNWLQLAGGAKMVWDSTTTNAKVEFGDSVALYVKGYTLNSQVVYESTKKPIKFEAGSLSGMPTCWETAALEMRYGEKATVIAPHHLAFKDAKAGILKPYSIVVFEIDLLEPGDY
ncbi:MAG: FKBP-type peptidyl-prolyl cis-trans isomerase [Bacteroidetes bacterium]|nr:FKBP-type peptidyl-prolyl cis-trans isomerase [Bacteroidota bacterium]